MFTDGIVLIKKRSEWTSRDVVNKACKILNTKKIGHCGTLDPFATGLLILGINKGTKLLQFLEASKKTYVAKLRLGCISDTLDNTAETIDSVPYSKFQKSEIIEVLQRFLGKSMQLTPKYSARKINGKKLYEYARAGEEVEDIYKEIEIFDIKLINYEDDLITFEATVSKGTYIRQLGLDIAKQLGTAGILVELHRSMMENFNVANAIDIDELTYDNIIDYNKVLDFMPSMILEGNLLKMVSNGMTVRLNSNEPKLLLKDGQNKILAIYERNEKGYYKCLRGL